MFRIRIRDRIWIHKDPNFFRIQTRIQKRNINVSDPNSNPDRNPDRIRPRNLLQQDQEQKFRIRNTGFLSSCKVRARSGSHKAKDLRTSGPKIRVSNTSFMSQRLPYPHFSFPKMFEYVLVVLVHLLLNGFIWCFIIYVQFCTFFNFLIIGHAENGPN